MSNEKADARLAKSVYDQLCRTLDERNWHYEKQADRLRVTYKVKGNDLSMEFIVKVCADRQLVLLLSPLPVKVDDEHRVAMAVAVSRANYSVMDGDFDYSYKNGEIMFRMSLSYCGCNLTKSALIYLIDCAESTVNRINGKFAAVSQGNMSLDEVVKCIEKGVTK